MKFEYKRKEICKNKTSRVIVSMTMNEARAIENDLRKLENLRHGLFGKRVCKISYKSWLFKKNINDLTCLHESTLIEQ